MSHDHDVRDLAPSNYLELQGTRRWAGSCATLLLRGGFPARSHSPRLPPRLLLPPSGRELVMPHCAGASFFRASRQAPPPSFSIQRPRDTELSCVCPLCRPRFTAAVSPRLSPSPLPSLPDGLLCGSAESPTPFLCGITMAAGVSLPALAIQVTVSDAIRCLSRAS